MKEFEGKKVYLYPTGNNARGKIKIKQAFIVKVARVNVTYIINGYSREQKEKYQGGHINSGCNSGYRVYESMQQISDYILAGEIARKLSEKLRYSSDFQRLGLDNVKAIAEISGIDLDDN